MRYQSFLTDSARWEGFPFRPGDIIISTPANAELAAHYEAKVRELAPPDLVAWLHPQGMGGVPPTEAA